MWTSDRQAGWTWNSNWLMRKLFFEFIDTLGIAKLFRMQTNVFTDATPDTCITRALLKAGIHSWEIQRLAKGMAKQNLDEKLMSSLDYSTTTNALESAGISSWGIRVRPLSLCNLLFSSILSDELNTMSYRIRYIF